MFDDIKREVVEPAETPDRDGEQHGRLERRVLDEQQSRSGQADEEKQNTLELDQARGGDVFHRGLR